MPTVRFTHHLQRYFPGLEAVEAPETRLLSVLRGLDGKFPGISDYILDERNTIRKHVNIFVGDELWRDKINVDREIPPQSEIYVFQALTGG